MDTLDYIELFCLIFLAVINVIFFCKMWQMTNNVAEILYIMKKAQQKNRQKVEVPVQEGDDIRIWTKNNMKVKVTGVGKLGLLCKALDGSDFIDYIPESELTPIE